MMVSVKREPIDIQDAHLQTSNGQPRPTGTRQQPPSQAVPSMSAAPPMAVTSQSPQTVANGSSQPAPAPSVASGAPQPEGNPEENEAEIDIQSRNGHFGWVTFDSTSVPCIFRAGKEYVPVRIVERKLLCVYPNSFPDELSKQDPLVSFFITQAEANLLNEINRAHCHGEYGSDDFTKKDLIVGVKEFEEFYSVVKKTFPNSVLKQINPPPDELRKCCGWVQLNNTVSPYVLRDGDKFVPLSVIRHAAGLLKDASCEGELLSQVECSMLNDTCKWAGLNFKFTLNSKIISLVEVLTKCKTVRVRDLPFDDPLTHAQYMDELPVENVSHQHAPQPGLPAVHPQAALQPLQHHMQQQQCMPAPLPQQGQLQQRQPMPQQQIPRQPMPPQQMQRQQQMLLQQQQQQRQQQMPRQQQPPQQQMPQPAPNGQPGPSMGPFMHPFQGQLPPNGLMVPISMANFQLPAMGPPGLPPFPQGIPQQQRHPGNGMLQTMHFPPGQLMSRPGQPPAQRPPQQQQQLQQPQPPPRGNYMISTQASNAAKNLSALSQPTSSNGIPMPWMMGMAPGMRPPMPVRGPQGQPPMNPGVRPIRPYPAHTNPPSLPPQQNPRVPPPMPQAAASAIAASRAMAPKPAHAPQQGDPKTARSNVPIDQKLKEKLMDSIQGYIVKEKSISCMNVDSGEKQGLHCLVEAVCKLYFPNCPFTHFINAMECALKRKVYDLSAEEEAAFIAYYNLPISSLKCSKSIKLQDLEDHFPQLNYLLNGEGAKKNDPASKGLPANQRPANGATPAGLSNSSSTKDPKKRPLPSGTSAGSPLPAKKPMKSVEDVIQKIKHVKEGTRTSATGHQNGKSHSGVIVLD